MSYTPPPPPGQDGPGDPSGGPPPPPGQSPGPGYGGPPAPVGPNKKATWSLVVGIVALPLAFCCSVVGLLGIVAIVLGRSARKEIAASGGMQSGDGMARAGFVLGIVDTAIAVVLIIVAVILVSTGDGTYNFNLPN